MICYVLPLSACIKAKGSLLGESRIETVDNCLFVQGCILLLNFNLNCSILCHHCPLYCTMYHQCAVYQNLYQQTSVIKCVPPPCTLLNFIVQDVLCIVICNPTVLCPILCTPTLLCMHFVSQLHSITTSLLNFYHHWYVCCILHVKILCTSGCIRSLKSQSKSINKIKAQFALINHNYL